MSIYVAIPLEYVTAEDAGISEGVLYQRFKSKDELFFAAMAPSAPDLEGILGSEQPVDDARSYLEKVALRLVDFFGEMIPVGLRVMTRPSFDRAALARSHTALARLQEGLVKRLGWFAQQKRVRKSAVEPTAQLLVCLAHDWALRQVASPRNASREDWQLRSFRAHCALDSATVSSIHGRWPGYPARYFLGITVLLRHRILANSRPFVANPQQRTAGRGRARLQHRAPSEAWSKPHTNSGYHRQ